MKYTEEDYLIDKLAGHLLDALIEFGRATYVECGGEIILDFKYEDHKSIIREETFEEWRARKEQEK